MAEVPPRFLFVLQSLAVPERNGVHNEVAVKMLRIQMRCHKDLKPVAPHSSCERHTNLLCKLRGDVGFLKAEITVIGLDAIRLVELLFHRDELLTGSLRVTVDALAEQLPFCFLSVLCIGDYITECLIIGVAVLRLGLCGFLRIGSVVENGRKANRDRPQLTYCHFRLLSPGRRN